MKKLVAFLIALSMVFGLVACSSQTNATEQPQETTENSAVSETPATSETEAPEEPAEEDAGRADLKQGFRVASINAMVTHGWRYVYEAQLKEVADEYIAQGIISEYTTMSPNNDQAKEAQLFETCVNEGYDIILLNAVGSSGLDTQIEMALDAGITVLFVDNLYPYEGVTGVQADQRIWAGNSCRAMCESLGGEGKVLMFNGQPGATGSSVRYDVWQEVLSEYPGIEVVFNGSHGWSQVESKVVMSEVLASGIEYDAVLTEEACVGILEAIEEANAPYPKFMTSDEEVGYLRMLDRINAEETVIDFYVIENPPGIGATALKLAVRLAAGWEWADGVLENNVYYYEPSYVVTPENLAQAIEDTKDMEDTDQISAYITEDVANAAFK